MSDTVTLRSEAKIFFSFTGPRLIGVVFAASASTRFALGGWEIADALVAVSILAFEPLTEWLIHVHMLHFKPRTILGRRIDPLVARKHREHHADPKDRLLVLVPMQVVVSSLVVSIVANPLLLPTVRLGVTALAVSVGMLFAYEWTHHLIHSAYRPKGRYYRYIWRAHRLHHFRNENYWFGVTIHLADHVLRTFPDKDAVPLSPTARTLGVEPA